MTADKRCLAKDMTTAEEEAAQDLSPFELKNRLIKRARKVSPSILNAGRGNPNFLNTLARLGFAKLMDFAVSACTQLEDHVALRPLEGGIHARLVNWLQSDPSEAAKFLEKSITYGIEKLELEPDAFVYELVDGILGDFYPSPPRILPNIEKIVGAYLNQALLRGKGIPADRSITRS